MANFTKIEELLSAICDILDIDKEKYKDIDCKIISAVDKEVGSWNLAISEFHGIILPEYNRTKDYTFQLKINAIEAGVPYAYATFTVNIEDWRYSFSLWQSSLA